MRCLYCGKPISDNATEHEKENRWHNRCIKRFFGTKHMPLIEVTEEKIQELASETINKGLTVPGVQKKLPLHLADEPMTDEPTERLTLVDYPAGYILKPQTVEYEKMPEFEHMAMRMAKSAGIKTVENALILNDGKFSYITKRADRLPGGKMLAMEDFCQLAERLTIDKYRGSYEKCAGIIGKHSERAGLDKTELFIRLIFSFIIGNSDMHLKNLSLIETEPGSREFIMAPAYDMLPVNIVLPDDSDQLALTLNGKRSNLKRKDFLDFADSCEIKEAVATRMIERLCNMQNAFERECDMSYLTAKMKEQTKLLIQSRIKILR